MQEFENDSSYTVPDMVLYDGHAILMDTMVFFVVGRLYQQRGVDHLAWIAMAFLSGLFSSGETKFKFLQNSVTLYSMHCIWPWQLWLFVVVVIALCGLLIFKHVQYLHDRQLLLMKATEMSLCVLLFLVPPMTSPYFHFHHWFAGWLVGMHCNIDVWWSRLTMAWCWGAYINGIAVYGRDPLLTCGYSFYLSYGDHCPYLQCYIDAMHNKSHSHYKPMVPQDWWNCTAEDYKP